MQRPKINKLYLYVRVVDGHIEHAELIRFDDGSASCVIQDRLNDVEEDPNAWKSFTSWLEDNGFVESNEAKAKKLIPEDWQPDKVFLRALM